MPEDPHHDAPEFARLHFCPDCAYDLQGLPREGHCPECGFQYDASMFSVLGKPWGMRWPSSLATFLIVIVPVYVLTYRFSFLAMTIICLSIVIGGSIVVVNQFRRSSPQWLLFTRDGVSARNTVDRIRVIPWQSFQQVIFQPYGFVMTQGKRTWLICLVREPFISVRENRPRRKGITIQKSGDSILFKVRATEDEARAIVNALRKAFSEGWQAKPE